MLCHKFGKFSNNNRYASQVSVGDEVLVSENDNVIPSTVINVFDQTLQGSYGIFMFILVL